MLDKINTDVGGSRPCWNSGSRHTARVEAIADLSMEQERNAVIHGVFDFSTQVLVGQEFEGCQQALHAGSSGRGSSRGIEGAVECLIDGVPQLTLHQRLANLTGVLNEFFP